jgi:hypothetical protein
MLSFVPQTPRATSRHSRKGAVAPQATPRFIKTNYNKGFWFLSRESHKTALGDTFPSECYANGKRIGLMICADFRVLVIN